MTYKSQKEELEKTKLLIQQQTDLAYKPDVFLKDFTIYVKGENNNDKFYPRWFSTEDLQMPLDEFPDKRFTGFQASLINIGVQAAKRIKTEWLYDIKQVANYFQKYPQNIVKGFAITPEEKNGRIKYTNLSGVNITLPFNNYYTDHYDFLIPYKPDEEDRNITIPQLYFEWYTYAILFDHASLVDRRKDLLPIDFPPIKLSLSYEDILGKEHSKTLNLDISNRSGLCSYSNQSGNSIVDLECKFVEE